MPNCSAKVNPVLFSHLTSGHKGIFLVGRVKKKKCIWLNGFFSYGPRQAKKVPSIICSYVEYQENPI